MKYKEFFKGKNVAIVGLGTYGEMIPDIKFLFQVGANVTVFDIRSHAKLKSLGLNPRIKELPIKMSSLGKIPDSELATKDMIILASDVSKRSTFLEKAKDAGVNIEYAEILFFRLAPPITLVGILGSAGKSSVFHLLMNIFKRSFTKESNQNFFCLDESLVNGTLTHLKKIKPKDLLLLRIKEEMMTEYQKISISPHVSVITSLSLYALKKSSNPFGILESQTYNNFIVAPNEVIDAIKERAHFAPKAKMLRTSVSTLPKDLSVKILGDHNKGNVALALETASIFKIDKILSHEVIEEFTGLKYRMEFVKKVKGIEFYNDSSAVNSIATAQSIRTLSPSSNLILIVGGAYTEYDYEDLLLSIKQSVHSVIFLPGSGTIGMRKIIEEEGSVPFYLSKDMDDAVTLAFSVANSIPDKQRRIRILLSPAHKALGEHSSFKERGEAFIKAVRKL